MAFCGEMSGGALFRSGGIKFAGCRMGGKLDIEEAWVSRRCRKVGVQMMTTSAVNGITMEVISYPPKKLRESSAEEKDVVVDSVFKQIFGNAYVMESEREEVAVAESRFRAGRLTVKEFARQCALSETYRRRFFECCTAYRAAELNFKHILGRGPRSDLELSEHVRQMNDEGREAAINALFDSDEYSELFGNDTVPYRKFKGTYPNMVEFVRTGYLESFPGTTDKALLQRARETKNMNLNHVLSLEGAGIKPKVLNLISGDEVKMGIPLRPDLELRTPTSGLDLGSVPPTTIAAIGAGVVLLILLLNAVF